MCLNRNRVDRYSDHLVMGMLFSGDSAVFPCLLTNQLMSPSKPITAVDLKTKQRTSTNNNNQAYPCARSHSRTSFSSLSLYRALVRILSETITSARSYALVSLPLKNEAISSPIP